MRALGAFRFVASAVVTFDVVTKLDDWSLNSIVLFGSHNWIYSVETERDHVV